MYVIEVAPLSKGGGMDRLSYYSGSDFPVGTLVNVPLRKSEVTGIVLSSTAVSMAKTAVRAATFSLRKLPDQGMLRQISPYLLRTASALYEEVPAGFGSILFSLLPTEVREGEESYPTVPESRVSRDPHNVSLLYATEEDRFLTYKSKVRQAFAHRGSVLLVVPTAATANKVAESLIGGIEDRTIIFTPRQTKKSRRKAYEAFSDLSSSKLIITTPAHAFLDRHDITSVIIENSRSGHYRSRVRPYLDHKRAIITHSKHTNRHVLLGDLIHSTEDEYYRRQEWYDTEGELQNRIAFTSGFRVVVSKDKPSSETPFQLFSPALNKAIKRSLGAKQNVFLYAARRGLAPVVICGDCGYIFRDPDSNTPYSLFRTFKDGTEKRWFLSTTSGRRVKAAENCSQCGSWRLRERGVGIQYIYDELVKEFKDEKILVFDHQTASTFRKATSIMVDFEESRGAILLGTSMALPYIEKKVGLCAVTSLEAVRSIPTWRNDEECFALLMRLREMATDEVIIQTRVEPDELLDIVKTGKMASFYNEELHLRQQLSYPPYAKMVHLTLSGPVVDLKPLETNIKETLSSSSWHFYSAPDSTEGRTTRYGLLRVPNNDWPDRKLMDILRSLPPSIRIEIDPARIV